MRQDEGREEAGRARAACGGRPKSICTRARAGDVPVRQSTVVRSPSVFGSLQLSGGNATHARTATALAHSSLTMRGATSLIFQPHLGGGTSAMLGLDTLLNSGVVQCDDTRQQILHCTVLEGRRIARWALRFYRRVRGANGTLHSCLMCCTYITMIISHAHVPPPASLMARSVLPSPQVMIPGPLATAQTDPSSSSTS